MNSRYDIISTITTSNNKNIYSQIYYPDIGYEEDDVYIITKDTDRLDLISLDFWGNVDDWWILAIINGLECDSIYPPKGIQLRIPSDSEEYKQIFKQNNSI